ncbi:NYN domain-containing protein [Georgenia sp. Z1491]|uniref:NYN domain-containing protein n=1 Tax=Georgenia sp. Z1491 TaxID=3416707 RepID=UPI003CF86334
MSDAPTTYLVIDGENIDATLGVSILGHRPSPEERPRWDRVLTHATDAWGAETKGLFFLNATSGNLPTSFIQALLAMDYRPIPLSGTTTEKVVDIGVQRMLEAILAQGHGNVLLVSHDGDFLPQMADLLDAGHRVGVLAFREFLNHELTALTGRGLEIFDLEDDVRAFTTALPRVRVIPLVSFDASQFL